MKTFFKALSNVLLNNESRNKALKAFFLGIINLPKSTFTFLAFFLLLLIFIIRKVGGYFRSHKVTGVVLRIVFPTRLTALMDRFLDRVVEAIERVRTFKVKRYYLINLAFNNLSTKKSRSLITIFGMSVGVGIIVYLLSLGYGIERMVISKVARLEELRMTDVISGETGDVRLNSKLMKQIGETKFVEKVLPMVSVVGKVNYRNANTDILAYAVTDEYLESLGIKLLKGKYYSDKGNYLSLNRQGDVQGASTEMSKGKLNEPITNESIQFNILPKKVLLAWANCSVESEIVGYVIRQEGGYVGQEVWGSDYAPYFPNGRVGYDKQNNVYLGKWLKTKAPIHDKLPKGGSQPRLDDDGRILWEEVCLEEKSLVISDRLKFAQVLGESTESAEMATGSAQILADETNEATEPAIMLMDVVSVGSSSGGLELVSLSSSQSASTIANKKADVVKYEHTPLARAVISSAMAKYLGISINNAVNDKFKSAFIIVKSLIGNESGKLTTEEISFEIVGVLDDESAEYFYFPLSDMQKIGLRNYSQFKVLVDDKKNLAKVRQEIEVLGVNTSSTADTVQQIEGFFMNVRLVLGLLGTIALAVAALGMFNTLTVSLLERTREIGGMKTMGMVSEEIQELFLSEAMIMGFAGGVGGLLLGFLAGELTSLMVSLVAVANGVGYLKLNYIPPFLILFILSSSFFVGIVTGLYPARRARKTSALNALRYE